MASSISCCDKQDLTYVYGEQERLLCLEKPHQVTKQWFVLGYSHLHPSSFKSSAMSAIETYSYDSGFHSGAHSGADSFTISYEPSKKALIVRLQPGVHHDEMKHTRTVSEPAYRSLLVWRTGSIPACACYHRDFLHCQRSRRRQAEIGSSRSQIAPQSSFTSWYYQTEEQLSVPNDHQSPYTEEKRRRIGCWQRIMARSTKVTFYKAGEDCSKV